MDYMTMILLMEQEDSTKLERSSAIALHVLETEHHVDFDNPEILSKYWPICRDRMNAEQWPISHQPDACNFEGKTINPAWNFIQILDKNPLFHS